VSRLSEAGRNRSVCWGASAGDFFRDRRNAWAADYGFRFIPPQGLSPRVCGAADLRIAVLRCAWLCLSLPGSFTGGRLRYKEGEAKVLEVVDARTTFYSANSAYQDGAVRYWVALAGLQSLTGVLKAP
jgi:hypothetical protein